MKIFICIPTLQIAGAERFVTELAINLKKINMDVSVIVTRKISKTDFYNELVENNIKIYDVSANNYVKACINIIKLLKQEKPNIIHTNIGAMLHMLLPTIFYRKAKHLFTVHSMGFRIFTGIKKKIAEIAFKTNLVKPIAICDVVKKSIYDSYGLALNKIPCIYNGVDTNKFSTINKENTEKVTFITVGTLYEIKNQKMIIDAFHLVKKEQDNIELIIIGEGTYQSYLENMVSKYNLNNYVKFLGRQKDIKKYLGKADIYLCSSKVEGLPLAVMEAMSMELPVITTPAGGVIDIVKNKENGIIISHDDYEAMAVAMCNLIENKVLREQMGKRSREIAKQHDVTICAKEYIDLYKSALKQK